MKIFQKGEVVESVVMIGDGRWSYGIVEDIKDGEYLIHFLGHDPSYDNWADQNIIKAGFLHRIGQGLAKLDDKAEESIKKGGIYKGDKEIIQVLMMKKILRSSIDWKAGDVIQDKTRLSSYGIILDSKKIDGKQKYLIHFLGYKPEDDKWYNIARMNKWVIPLNTAKKFDTLSIKAIEKAGIYEGDKDIIRAMVAKNLIGLPPSGLRIGSVVVAQIFSTSGKVWVFARIQKIKDKDGRKNFLLHYLGHGFWNDKWVTSGQIITQTRTLKSGMGRLDYCARDSIINGGIYEGDQDIIKTIQKYVKFPPPFLYKIKEAENKQKKMEKTEDKCDLVSSCNDKICNLDTQHCQSSSKVVYYIKGKPFFTNNLNSILNQKYKDIPEKAVCKFGQDFINMIDFVDEDLNNLRKKIEDGFETDDEGEGEDYELEEKSQNNDVLGFYIVKSGHIYCETVLNLFQYWKGKWKTYQGLVIADVKIDEESDQNYLDEEDAEEKRKMLTESQQEQEERKNESKEHRKYRLIFTQRFKKRRKFALSHPRAMQWFLNFPLLPRVFISRTQAESLIMGDHYFYILVPTNLRYADLTPTSISAYHNFLPKPGGGEYGDVLYTLVPMGTPNRKKIYYDMEN